MEALLNRYRVIDSIRGDIYGGHQTGQYTHQSGVLKFDNGLELVLELTDFNDLSMAARHGYDPEKPWTITASFHGRKCLTRHFTRISDKTIVHYATRVYSKCRIPPGTPKLISIYVNRTKVM